METVPNTGQRTSCSSVANPKRSCSSTTKADYFAIRFRVSDTYFPSEKKIGLRIYMQSDIANFDGVKTYLRIRWPTSSDFGPKADDSVYRILKWKMASVLNQVNLNCAEPGTAAAWGTHISRIDGCIELQIQP